MTDRNESENNKEQYISPFRRGFTIIDCEIQNPITEDSQWNRTDLMKVSVCVAYTYDDERYRIFGPRDIDRLKNLLITSERVIGFNIDKFDLPLIFKQKSDQPVTGINTYDILVEIWKSLDLNPCIFTEAHKGYSLDNICRSTFGISKSDSGAEIPIAYQQGDYWKVIDHCLTDVIYTKRLYEHIITQGYIKSLYKRNLRIVPIRSSPLYAIANDNFVKQNYEYFNVR